MGIKSYLKSNPENYLITSFRFIYDVIVDVLARINENNTLDKQEIKYKIFSDNAIFAIKYTESNFRHNANLLLTFISMFQNFVVSERGLLLRGGICTGDLYIDDNFVLGSGLITAYNIENTLAIYPRIIVDDDIIKRYHAASRYCFRGDDNLLYIDYLSYAKQNFKKNISDHYREIYSMSNGVTSRQVKQKLDWIKCYHNRFAGELRYDELKFDDVGQTFWKNISVNEKNPSKKFADKFKSTEQQTVAYSEGYSTIENNKEQEIVKPIERENGVFYSKNYFSKVGLYSEISYIYLYQDRNGTKYVALSDIEVANKRSGAFTFISVAENSKWVFKEWNGKLKKFVDKASGKFIYDVGDKNVYISLSDYETKIKPILDKYIN